MQNTPLFLFISGPLQNRWLLVVWTTWQGCTWL